MKQTHLNQCQHGGNPGKAGGGKKKRAIAKEVNLTSLEEIDSPQQEPLPIRAFVEETAASP
jgi:hypothetical protein